MMISLNMKIFEAGIVGAGGAGFPTHAKMKGRIRTVIINGVECEPLLQVDKMLALHYSKELILGLKFVLEAVGANEAFIGIKNKYTQVYEALQSEASPFAQIKVVPLPNIYPIGDEIVLIEALTGIVMKKGELPITKEILVLNTETVLNIYEKNMNNKNVTHSYVTLTGEVKNPGTYHVPLGMAISEFIAMAVPTTKKPYAFVNGGPMTGYLGTPDEVVKKTTKGIIVLEPDHYLIRRLADADITHIKRIMASCSQCRACTDMCPRHLMGHQVQPHLLMNAMANGLDSQLHVLKTSLGCVNCGVCELYACHHDLSPRTMMMKVKQAYAKEGIRPTSEDCVPMHSDRAYRRVPADRLTMHLGLKPYDHPIAFYAQPLLADKVKIPLLQHIGQSAQPSVVIHQKVEIGTLIARADAKSLSANIHSSLLGRVTQITTDYIEIQKEI